MKIFGDMESMGLFVQLLPDIGTPLQDTSNLNCAIGHYDVKYQMSTGTMAAITTLDPADIPAGKWMGRELLDTIQQLLQVCFGLCLRPLFCRIAADVAKVPFSGRT